MDQRTVLVMFVVAILAHQGMMHERLELPTGQDAQAVSPALLQAIRIVEADLHTHRDRPHGVDDPIGQDAADKVQSDAQSAPFVSTMDGNERRKFYPNGSAWFSSQGETATPLTLRFLNCPDSVV